MTLVLLAAQAGLGSFMVNVLLMSLVLMGAAYLLSGVEIEDFTRAIIVAIVLAVLNATLGRFLNFVTTPIRWITLGLFSLDRKSVV